MTVFSQTVSQSQPFLLEVGQVSGYIHETNTTWFVFLTSRTYTEGLEQRKQSEDMDWFQIKSSIIRSAHSNADVEPAL